MKKIIATLLTATLALSLAACAAKPASTSTPASASTPASVSVSTPESVVAEPATVYPLTYTSKTMMGDTTSQVFGAQDYYVTGSEVTIEYCQAQDDLYMALNGKTSWPEFNDEWKGYGYSNIVNENGVSARTFAAGLYGERNAKVIKENQDKLKAFGDIKSNTDAVAPEGQILVPYSKLDVTGEIDIKTAAEIAQQALYLQAWMLVPAEFQGVMITANGMDYTAEMILEELKK